MLGDFIAVFAVQVAVVFRMHGTPGDMAGVFIASALPSVVLGPLAGVFADRWNPQRTMIFSDVIRAVLIVLMGLAVTLPQIYIISLAISCASSFFSPARSIVMPSLVPRENLLRAAAQMQQTMQVMRIVSPALASGLVVMFGARACFGADSLSFLFSAGMIATLPLTHSAAGPATKQVQDITKELLAGLRFLFTDARVSLVTTAMAAGTFAAGCFGALASIYVRDVLHAQAGTLGLISSAIAAGTLGGSLCLGWLPKRIQSNHFVGIGMASVGAAILLMGAFPLRVIALAGATGIGLGIAMVVVVSTVVLQTNTPVDMRGRVAGAASSLAALAQLGAMLFAGTLATHVGVRGVFFVSAGMLLLVGVASQFRGAHVQTSPLSPPSPNVRLTGGA